MRRLLLLGLVALACRPSAPATAHGTVGHLEITQAFAYEPITPASGAAYFRVQNRGAQPDTLIAITSPAARTAVVHGADMSQLTSVEIPAGGEILLVPGKSHLMLSDFSAVPVAGAMLPLSLRFARAGEIVLQLPVRRYGE